MHTRSKLVSIFMSLVLALGLCPAPALATDLAAANAGLTVQTAGTDDYPSNLKSAARDSVVDPWRFYNRECTSFVAWRLNNDNGVAFNNYYGGAHWGNANNWGSAARSLGITVDSNPGVGSVAWWNSGTYGHVAWIQSVNGNNVTIEEYNYGNSGAYNRRTIAKSSASGYIHIKDLGNANPSMSVASGKYIVQSKIGNRVLDIDAGKNDNNANAQVWQPMGSYGQIFNIARNGADTGYYIQMSSSYKFLDAEGGGYPANVSQYEGNGGDNQNWVFEDAGDGYVYIRNLQNGYLDVVASEDKNGANVQVFGYHGGDNQKWKLLPVSGAAKQTVSSGKYIIQSKIGQKVVDIEGAKDANGTNARIWQPNGTASQTFTVGYYGTLYANYFQLTSTGKYLDSQGGGSGISNVWEWEANGGYGQNWFVEDAGGGYVYIRNLLGYYLDAAGSGNDNGTNVQAYTFNGGENQKWKLVKVSGATKTRMASGSYSVQTKLGNAVLDVEGASKENGANVRVWSPNGSASQVFNVGWYDALECNNLQLAASSKYVDAAGGSGATTVNVSQFEGNGGYNQNWFFEDAGAGYYYIRNLLGYYLGVDGGKSADGANVRTYAFDGSDYQKWKLVSASAANPNPADPAKPATPTEPTTPTTPTEPTQPTTPTTPTGPTDQNPADGTDKGDEPQTGGETAKPTSVAGATVTGVKSKTYSGKALTQSPTVKVGFVTLKAGTDYTLKYANNVKAGKATMTITGQGAYTGTKAVAFAVNKANVKSATAAKVKPQKYERGKAVKPSPKITYKGKTLTKGSDYTLKYKNNKKRGTATITVKGKGNFKGSKAVTFKIR